VRVCDGLRDAIVRTATRIVEDDPLPLQAAGITDVGLLASALGGTLEAFMREAGEHARRVEEAAADQPVAQG